MHSSEDFFLLFLHELATDKDCKKREQLDYSAFFSNFVSLFFFRVPLAVVLPWGTMML
jgi:hypothetical protein